MAQNTTLVTKINKMKKEQNILILSHVYQQPEIQDIADHIGDSLALSKIAQDNDAETIVFCGVKFMAETAHILSPEKTVLLPKMNAGCDLADMATIQQLDTVKQKYPYAKVVCYINSSAEIKAESDICCTSANAVNIVTSLEEETILFIPDKNLGSYVAEHTDQTIIPWDGYCYVHEHIQPDIINTLKKTHPSAEIIVHPECSKPIRDLADCIGGTAKMYKYVQQSSCTSFIVGTEDNFIHHLKKGNPEKTFYPVNTECKGMRTITLPDILETIEKRKNIITLPKKIRTKAYKTIDAMMKLS